MFIVSFGHKILKNNPHWHGDTEGFYPDYWCFSNIDDWMYTIVESIEVEL